MEGVTWIFQSHMLHASFRTAPLCPVSSCVYPRLERMTSYFRRVSAFLCSPPPIPDDRDTVWIWSELLGAQGICYPSRLRQVSTELP